MRWKGHQETLAIMSSVNADRFEQQRLTDNWFTFALTVTILWIVFVLIILVMRKRIQMVSQCFNKNSRMHCMLS